jgi:hypothetical protein
VANSADGVGQLIANSALMKGERELLRKRDEPPTETSAPRAARPAAEPITNDSKVVSAVLLTLLDERLQADAALIAGPKSAISDNGEGDVSKRVAAKYAADGLIPGDDLIAPQTPAQPDVTRASAAPPLISPDLQTFMQRFVAAVAGGPASTSPARGVGTKRGAHARTPSAFYTAFVLRAAGFAAGIIWLIVLVAVWALH